MLLISADNYVTARCSHPCRELLKCSSACYPGSYLTISVQNCRPSLDSRIPSVGMELKASWAGRRRSCSTSRCLGGGVTGAEWAVTIVRCHQTGSQCLNLGLGQEWSALRNLARKSLLIAYRAAWKECCLLSLLLFLMHDGSFSVGYQVWWELLGAGQCCDGDQGQSGGASGCRREHDGSCPWVSHSEQCLKASTDDQEFQTSRESLLTVPRHRKVFPCLTSPPCTYFHWQWTWKSSTVLAAAAFYI